MRHVRAVMPWAAMAMAGVGMLAGYAGYFAWVVPVVTNGGTIPLLLWLALGSLPLGTFLLAGAMLRRGIHAGLVGMGATCLRRALEFLLARGHLPGFYKSEAGDGSWGYWTWQLLAEAVVWSAVVAGGWWVARWLSGSKVQRTAERRT
jgi:hypothetical protein